MALQISGNCIVCDACLGQCPVNAIMSDEMNSLSNRYYIYPEKCVECVGIYETPQCAEICPVEGCITWDMPFTAPHILHFKQADYALTPRKKPYREKPYRKEITLPWRQMKKALFTGRID